MASAMDDARLQQWDRIYHQKCQGFLEEQCYGAATVDNIEDLNASIRELTAQYGNWPAPKMLDAFRPSLDHVLSFRAAISSAAQNDKVASLVWGGVQAVIECAIKSHDMQEDVLSLLSELNNELPRLTEYTKMLPRSPRLHWPIQDLYNDYLEYCLQVVRYIRRRPSFNVMRYLWSGSPHYNLKKTKERIQQHVTDLRREVEFLVQNEQLQETRKMQRIIAASTSFGDDEDGFELDTAPEVDYPVSTVSMYRNYTFVGRAHILDSLDCDPPGCPTGTQPSEEGSLLDSERHTLRPFCYLLTGIGGVGKSQIALEYTYRAQSKFDAIFWLPCESDADLIVAYAAIADKLHLVRSRKDDSRRHDKIQRARNWLETTTRRWLLVFDNVESTADLNEYMPARCRCQGAIIITTQVKMNRLSFTDNFQRIPVDMLSDQDAVQMLFKYMDREEPFDDNETDAAMAISKRVDGLPLALAAVGGYISQSQSSVVEFLQSFRNTPYVWEANAVGPAEQYEKSLRTVFDIALNELTMGARSLIHVMAFLDPDCIQEELFYAHFEDPALEYCRSQQVLVENIRVLSKRQLVRREHHPQWGWYFVIHRTLQWNILLRLSEDPDKRWSAFCETMLLLGRGIPKVSPLDQPEPEKWREFDKYVPHVLNVRKHCLWPDPPIDIPLEFANLLADLASHMWSAGLAVEGQDALETSLQIMQKKTDGEFYPKLADVHAKLGILLRHNGISDRAKVFEHRTKALNMRNEAHSRIPPEMVSLADEIRLYNVKWNLAWTHLHEEEFEKAEPIMEECLQQYRKWGDEDKMPFEYAKYYTVMSFVRLCAQERAASVDFARRGADLAQKAFGNANPVTVQWHFAYANVVFHAGFVERAWEINNQVLEARVKCLGQFHHMTLESHSTCAWLLQKLGRADETKELLEQCLERRKRSHWNVEGVARAQFRYSKVLEAVGQSQEAMEQLEAASRVRRQFQRKYPLELPGELEDEEIFDKMVSLWASRFTGRLSQIAPEPIELHNN